MNGHLLINECQTDIIFTKKDTKSLIESNASYSYLIHPSRTSQKFTKKIDDLSVRVGSCLRQRPDSQSQTRIRQVLNTIQTKFTRT